MKYTKKDIKNVIIIAFACIAFYLGLKNFSIVIHAIGYILGIVSPFILGAALAFILNVLMSKIEKKLFADAGRLKKGKRAVSLIMTLAIVFGLLVVVMSIIVPQLGSTMIAIGKKLPTAYAAMIAWIDSNMGYLNSISGLIDGLNISWDEIISKISVWIQGLATDMIDGGINLATTIVGAIVNFVIGFIFAIYILLAKEKLAGQFKQAMYACLGEKRTDKILAVCRLSNNTFAGFISGQCLEACIIGVMFFVAMTILKMPYAMLISVVIAFTALIPIVGSTIGCVVGALLILMENPMQAVVFVVMFLIIQQIEGNLIYPHVVGGSVGLPSIWVLAAITIGGNLMGVLGMLIFIPLCSVIYALFRVFVKERLAESEIDPSKWSVTPSETTTGDQK
ncbi:MAG: AI-2E family transporter [Eubacteriaceae bacterium]|nr:AI-2E family transporter [Eubacteriaceae bacterium]